MYIVGILIIVIGLLICCITAIVIIPSYMTHNRQTAQIVYLNDDWVIIWPNRKLVVDRGFDTKQYAETWLDGYNYAKGKV